MPLKTDTVEEPVLNLTPMIDIVFLLLIFFMVGTQFTELERQFDIHLPTVTDAQPLTAAPDEITVNIRKDGEITVNGEVRTLVQLTGELRAAKENYADQGVLIRAEGDGKYQHVIDVLSIVVKVGMKSHSLAYRIKPEERG